jgi:Insulinase (Peptidase family M16)/Peptidase M16 inactive domain
MSRVHSLSNGVRVVVDPMPGLKSFALVAAVRGGSRWESESQSGWSHLLEHLVFKGAGDMSAREIVERIEAEGGSINAATGYERTSFEVRGMAEALPRAVQVVSDLMLRPRLDPAEIEREKDVVAQEIAEAFDTPDDHVFEMAQTRAFEGQSLGRPILGSIDSLAPADKASMEAWRATLYAPERMVLAVSGAVDEDRLLALAEAAFGAARPGPAAEPEAARFIGGHVRLARRIERRCRRSTRTSQPCGLRSKSWAEAWPRACSRARAKSAAWPTPSTPITNPMRTAACWASMRVRRRTGRSSWPRSAPPKSARSPTRAPPRSSWIAPARFRPPVCGCPRNRRWRAPVAWRCRP